MIEELQTGRQMTYQRRNLQWKISRPDVITKSCQSKVAELLHEGILMGVRPTKIAMRKLEGKV